jgi:Pregnancy-associated plasma protein-A/CHU_C Type IX secretion signal domain/PQQ-like domain/SprB repeat
LLRFLEAFKIIIIHFTFKFTNMRIFYSKNYLLTFFVIFSFCLNLKAQNLPNGQANTEGSPFCAGEDMMQQFLKNAEQKIQHQLIEQQIQRYMLSPAGLRSRSTSAIVTLPVVAHIIHNSGSENISNAQVLQGIKDLNDAFANRGYYDPTTGVNTDIQFCLAQRDPNNQPTNGITRDISPLTNMTMETDDINLKNINRWQPTCYINIWLVKEINSNSSGSGVAGYAYLPSAHGSIFDGIVEEARWFGSSPANSGVTIHEMGHYLGLYHTFNGDCTNDNCLTDGDHVCDTPPDRSRGAGCNPSANSCTTDTDDPSVNNPFRALGLGGKGDMADMSDNYMDYSPFSCYSSFTQGQKDRMSFFIQNTRKSLLACKSCETPCPAPVTAAFTPRGQTIGVGTSLTFMNTSTNATSYKWRIGSTNYSTPNVTHPFNTIGSFKVVLDASSADARCQSAGDSVVVDVVCPVKASFTPLGSEVQPNTSMDFVATVQGATTTQWKVNGIVAGSGTTLNRTFSTVGNYEVEFVASNGFCTDGQKTIVVVSSNNVNCNNPLFSQNYETKEGILILNTIREDKNNTFIAAGSIQISVNNTTPYLLKLDALGKVLWTKKVEIDGSGTFYNMKTTTDGGYIAVGEANEAPLIAKFNAIGNLEWVNSTNVGSTSALVNIVQTKDGGFAASGHLETNYINFVAKFRADGTPQWTREIGSTTTDWSAGIEEMTDGNLLVASNTTSTTNTYLMKLDVNTGEFIWQKQYSSEAPNSCCDHSFDDINKTPDGNFLVTGNWSADVIIFQKIDNNGNILWAKKITQTGKGLRGTQSFQTADGGYVVSSTDYNNQLSRIIIKLDNNFKVQWQKIVGVGGGVTLKHVLPLSNGDYWIAANQLNGFSISKTDALAKSCEDFPNSNVIIEDVRSQVSDGSFSNDVGREMVKLTPEITPFEVSVKNRCQTCDTTQTSCKGLFSKGHGVDEGVIFLHGISKNNDNTIITYGAVYPKSIDNKRVSFLSKMTERGDVIWTKHFELGRLEPIINVKVTKDGGFLAVGRNSESPAIVKFNSNGVIEWSKSVEVATNGMFKDVIETPNGDIIASGFIERVQNIIVAKFSANGTTQWIREINTVGNFNWVPALVLTTDGNLLVSGKNLPSVNTCLMKIDVNNGNLLWQKQYSYGATDANSNNYIYNISKTFDNNYLAVATWDTKVILKKFDDNGNVIWTKQLSETLRGYTGTHAFQTSNGGYMIQAIGDGFTSIFIKLDSNFKIEWQKKIGINEGLVLPNTVFESANGSFYIGYTQNSQQPEIFITKVDSLGKSCQSLPDANMIIEDVRAQTSNVTFTSKAGKNINSEELVTIPIVFNVKSICDECKEICNKCFDNDSVKIVGTQTICDFNSAYTFKLKDYKCTQFKTDWLIRGVGLTDIFSNDTTCSMRFTQSTTFDLTAIIKDSCGVDTVVFKVQAIAPPPILELGPDKTICQTGVFTFKAPRGFKSYQWQDFSTDSVFTAFGAGKYWVRVVDSCGFTQSDTVNVIQLNVPNVNIAPDSLKICQGDSLVVTAPTGYATYRWSPSVGVNDTFKRVITLTPSVSGRYFCAVSTLAGCVSSDSVWVEVKPLNNAVRTAAICTGQTYRIGDSTFTKTGVYSVRLKSTTGDCDTIVNLTLTSINNFTKQIDSLICTNQTIKIGDSTFTKAGNYTVILRGRGGACDTVVTVNLTVPNIVEQTLNRTICQGQSLKIGDSTFLKNGTYKVFINNTLCKDTLITVNLKVTDLSVQTTPFNTCPNAQNGRITSAIRNGTPPYSFTWSNGETTANLNNLSAGIYLVTVSDVNNCKDTASVTIKATPQYSYNLSVKQPTCFGDANGEIRITSTEKLSISFDSVVFNRSGFLNNLRAGNYPIFVKDSNNCIYSELINIPQPPQLTLSLPADTLLKLGDSVRIESFTNGVGRLKYRWQPIRDLSCDTCATVIAKPTTGIFYTLTLTDTTGCQVKDDIRLLVNKTCNIFIPNVFSPFSTVGSNDVFYPFASDCAKQVLLMEVYDRWGEKVFYKVNFPLNDPFNAWDGTFNGKQLEAAVYTYRIEILLADGRLERFFGDVTLIR